MRSIDRTICLNMLEAIHKVQEISSVFISHEDFAKDYIRFDATMMNFVVIGEMANKLSDTFKEEHNDIAWRRIAK